MKDYMCADCGHEQDSMGRQCDGCGSVRVVLASMATSFHRPPPSPTLQQRLSKLDWRYSEGDIIAYDDDGKSLGVVDLNRHAKLIHYCILKAKQDI